MAPALTEAIPAAPHTLTSKPVDETIFPDGLRTSGQHNPFYELIRPYEDFPKHIDGPTVWKAEDYSHNPERWTHVFSDEEIAELGAAADAFIAAGHPLTGMTKELFPLPRLAPFFGAVRKEIFNGKGFILFRGVPVGEWGLHKSAVCCNGFVVLQGAVTDVCQGRVYGSGCLLWILRFAERARACPWPRKGLRCVAGHLAC